MSSNLRARSTAMPKARPVVESTPTSVAAELNGDPGIANLFLFAYSLIIAYLSLSLPRMAIVLCSMAVFFAFSRSVAGVTRSVWTGYASLTTRKKASWTNLMTSTAHSVVISIMSIIVIALHWRAYSNPNWLRPSVSITMLPFITMAISCGYFAVDTWDMIQNGEARTALYLIVHHFAILVPFTIGLYTDLGLFYLILTMLCEINTIFLHVRVLLSFAGFTRENSLLFRFVWWEVFYTMYIFRLPVHAYLGLRVMVDRKMWPSDTLWATGLAALVIFNVLNFQLNVNISKAYSKMRRVPDSKRVRAIDFLARSVWPFLCVVLGVVGYVILEL